MPNLSLELPEFMAFARARDFVVLDTETTGLKKPAEICQIAILDPVSSECWSRYVKPKNGIPVDATRIHGITEDAVAGCPPWYAILPEIVAHIGKRSILVYNATYDRMMFHSSDEAWGMPHREWSKDFNWVCAMNAFSEFRGVWNDYFGNWQWWKLVEACGYMGVRTTNAHNAIADCDMTLRLVNAMLCRWDREQESV